MDKFDPLLINTLASSRSVITFDYAGVGLSNGEIATTIKQSANDAIQFLLLIGEKEVDILGFSLGGLVAQIIALNANSTELKVRKLILAGTTSSAGPDMINVSKVSNIASSAGAGPQDADIETFQQLFFLKNKEGRAALEQWWVRIHERSATTSGEEPATWLSYGYADGGKGIQAQSKQVSAFKDIATSQGLEGSYDRLGELNIPVLVANGKVSSLDRSLPLNYLLTSRSLG
jgi:pimeloyl-ACP methyl ester carboxylesterase